MHLNKVFGIICFVISPVFTYPASFADDGLYDFLLDGPSKKSDVKRRIFADNAGRQLKQISLSSLVSDLENNIFDSALSLNKVLMDKNVSVSEIKVKGDSEHDVTSDHHSIIKQEKPTTIAATKKSTANFPASDKVILQTTEKVPLNNGEPTHIVIDRITIQPHKVGLASIPIFELKRTGEDEAAVSKTALTSLDTTSSNSPTIPSTTNVSILSSEIATNTTTEADIKPATTPKNIEKLKEAEEELKEKFAEIEAEPIILSARV